MFIEMSHYCGNYFVCIYFSKDEEILEMSQGYFLKTQTLRLIPSQPKGLPTHREELKATATLSNSL